MLHESISRLNSAILVVRTRRGLEVFEGAVRAGYIEAIEVDPVYAVQDATLLKSSQRVLKRCRGNYRLPPGFTTIVHEVVYHIGRFLASREGLWGLLKWYHKLVPGVLYRLAMFLDTRLGTSWGEVCRYVKLLQRLRVPKELNSLQT